MRIGCSPKRYFGSDVSGSLDLRDGFSLHNSLIALVLKHLHSLSQTHRSGWCNARIALNQIFSTQRDPILTLTDGERLALVGDSAFFR